VRYDATGGASPRVSVRRVVPDTSVVLKWLLTGEADRARALTLREAYLLGLVVLVVPELLLYEVTNVLRYKPDWDVARIAQAVRSVIDLGVEIAPATADRMTRALEIAVAHDIAVYDAAFVALAEDVGGEFVTSDERLVRKLTPGMRRVVSLRSLSVE
jgi:predicted nucleic acid-binding protein